MGNCLRRRRAIHPDSPVIEARSHPKAESEIDDPDVSRRKSLYRTVDPTIPKSFYPEVVGISREEEQCRRTRQKIVIKETEKPLRCRIEDIMREWREGSLLGQIESHALSIPSECAASVETLALSLTNPRSKYVNSLCALDPFHLQIAKAYAIYFWVANNIRLSHTMWKRFLSNSEGLRSSSEAEEVLQRRECLSIGHANLFLSIATAAGLTARVVMGNIKLCRSLSSQDYKQEFKPSRVNQHWWNMVSLFDGVWFPVDCACGAGMIAPHLDFQPKFTSHYFATQPDHLIFSHIPVEPEWQLLQEVVSTDKLCPMIAPSLFPLCLGVQPLCWAETINVDQNSNTTTLKVTFRAPPNLSLTAELRRDFQCYDDTSTSQDVQSQLQNTYIGREDCDEVIVSAAVPGKGVYFLDIHAQHNGENLMCVSYMINCLTKPTIHTGFPMVFEKPSIAFQFKPLYWNTPQASNLCVNDGGKMDFIFRCLPDVQFHHCLICGKHASGQPVNLALDAHYYCTTITHDPTDRSLHKLSVVFPTKGWWTIYLCAVKKSGDIISGYTALLDYPVFAKKELRRCSYPHTHSSDVRFEFSDPISCSGTNVLVVPFFSVKRLKLYSCLCYESLEAKHETHYTLAQSLEGVTAQNEYRYQVQVVFPKPGKWFIRVFSQAVGQSPGAEYLSLFNMLIDVDGCIENAVFPRIEQDVVEQCNICLLHEHSLIMLGDGRDVLSLKFRAPNEIKFDQYIELQNENNADDLIESVFHRHHTFLQVREESGTQCTYELKAAFPRTGEWNVVLCAGKTSMFQLKVALRVPVNISNSIELESQLFPVIHPALSEFGIKFSGDIPLYRKNIHSPDFNFDFSSSKSINYAWSLNDVIAQKETPHSSNVYLENIEDSEGDNVMQRLRIIFPKPGIWLVKVVARRLLTDIVADNTLSLSLHYQPVFDLIVDASNASLGHMAFPRIFESFHSKFGLSIKSADVPLPSRAKQLPATCIIKFYSPPGIMFWHHCKEFAQLQEKRFTRMTSNPHTGLHELSADITKRGQWTVYLYAKFVSDASNNWTAVLQHSITVKSPKSNSSSSISTL